jgi:hypothetical protein
VLSLLPHSRRRCVFLTLLFLHSRSSAATQPIFYVIVVVIVNVERNSRYTYIYVTERERRCCGLDPVFCFSCMISRHRWTPCVCVCVCVTSNVCPSGEKCCLMFFCDGCIADTRQGRRTTAAKKWTFCVIFNSVPFCSAFFSSFLSPNCATLFCGFHREGNDALCFSCMMVRIERERTRGCTQSEITLTHGAGTKHSFSPNPRLFF